MARFWNKYPYTDFHELNIGWCVDKITDFEARVTSVEEDVAALKVRATALESRMSTAEERIARQEQDIHGLSTEVGNLGTRVTTLENADIQDADMLEGVSSVEAGNASVTVNFSAAAYTDGVKTAGTDAAVIPAASSDAAGVMLPGEKAKLAPITVNGNDVTFAGKVSGSAATSNNDYVTKEYVDSLAIGGSATGAYSADILTNKSLTNFYSPAGFTIKDYSYGLMHEWVITLNGTLQNAIAKGANVATAYVPNAIKPKHFIDAELTVYDENSGEYFKGVTVTVTPSTGLVTVSNSEDGAAAIPADAEIGCYGRIVFVDVAEQ